MQDKTKWRVSWKNSPQHPRLYPAGGIRCTFSARKSSIKNFRRVSILFQFGFTETARKSGGYINLRECLRANYGSLVSSSINIFNMAVIDAQEGFICTRNFKWAPNARVTVHGKIGDRPLEMVTIRAGQVLHSYYVINRLFNNLSGHQTADYCEK